MDVQREAFQTTVPALLVYVLISDYTQQTKGGFEKEKNNPNPRLWQLGFASRTYCVGKLSGLQQAPEGNIISNAVAFSPSSPRCLPALCSRSRIRTVCHPGHNSCITFNPLFTPLFLPFFFSFTCD